MPCMEKQERRPFHTFNCLLTYMHFPEEFFTLNIISAAFPYLASLGGQGWFSNQPSASQPLLRLVRSSSENPQKSPQRWIPFPQQITSSARGWTHLKAKHHHRDQGPGTAIKSIDRDTSSGAESTLFRQDWCAGPGGGRDDGGRSYEWRRGCFSKLRATLMRGVAMEIIIRSATAGIAFTLMFLT